MTRKRFIKLLMSEGHDKRTAEDIAAFVRGIFGIYNAENLYFFSR